MNSINTAGAIQGGNYGSLTLSPTSPYNTLSGALSSISNVEPNIIVSATSENALEVKGNVLINGKINCTSLEERLAEIENRLALLQVRPDLEERVDKLKEIGDQYRAMAKKLDAQQALWDLLSGEKTS